MDKAGQPPKKLRPRTCVGCMEESPKRAMMRIIRSPEGEVRYDPTGKANGRGAYLCMRAECVEAARKRKSLGRALKTEVPQEIYDELAALCRGKDAE